MYTNYLQSFSFFLFKLYIFFDIIIIGEVFLLKNNRWKGILTVFFFLTTLVSVGYICYENFFEVYSEPKNSIEKTEENYSEEKAKNTELDVNSRLVQSLYNKVGLSKNSYDRYKIYESNDNLLVKEMSDEDKLALVYTNLPSYSFDIVPNHNLQQAISSYQIVLSPDWANFISYDDINLEFRRLFGYDETFSKDSIIRADSASLQCYIYNSSLDGYILYSTVGGIEAPISYQGRIVSANKNEKEITITEEVSATPPEGNPSIVGIYVYTFHIDDDGMYSFVSRIKEE